MQVGTAGFEMLSTWIRGLGGMDGGRERIPHGWCCNVECAGIRRQFSVRLVARYLVVTASDLRLNGRGFDPQPPHYRSVSTGMSDRLSTGAHNISVCNQPPMPTQPPTLCWTENEYLTKCTDALRLGNIRRIAHSIRRKTREWQVKVCDPWNTYHFESFRDEFHN